MIGPGKLDRTVKKSYRVKCIETYPKHSRMKDRINVIYCFYLHISIKSDGIILILAGF